MSVNGINNNPLNSFGPLSRTDANRDANRAAQNGQTGTAQQAGQQARAAQANALKPQTPIAGAAATQTSVPAEAPAGTDPTLWSVLTSEERNFFAKTAALGPLTYSRIKEASNPAPPAARGVRLDVRA
ncbi:MAG TPA: hypothetical protein VGE27_12070 [Gemmatimonas sp.]|uniref:hypothetical protein n=1 Tax=Gemmatimonas sp. TaxID=1962908 RepID=UPI002ED84BB6